MIRSPVKISLLSRFITALSTDLKGVFDWSLKTYPILKTVDFAEMNRNWPNQT